MLQAISSDHDDHHIRSVQNSVASITSALNDGRVHLLLAASGSVATIKLPQIIRALGSRHPNLSIRVLLTSSARQFLGGQAAEQPTVSSLRALLGVDGVYGDEDEWREPWRRGNSIMHIELRRWADLLVVAPLSANTMAKVVAGMADGLLTSVIRAWDARGELDSDVGRGPSTRKVKRIVVAPAMNTAMWRHPVTSRQIKVLTEDWGVSDDGEGSGWFEVLPPQKKTLACGDIGDGGMMEWTEIVKVIEERLGFTNLEASA
jgi:phosphopantothenoylcysteine decarboxylase